MHTACYSLQERIRELEEAAMGEKAWHMKGEVDAASRPLNSALEMDLDYDTTAKPPPAPTEEATQVDDRPSMPCCMT